MTQRGEGEPVPPEPSLPLPPGSGLPLRVGERVVIRYRLDPPASALDVADSGRGSVPTSGPRPPTKSDALGELLEVGPGFVVVATRRGPVRIRRESILIAKRVPPPPERRRPRVSD